MINAEQRAMNPPQPRISCCLPFLFRGELSWVRILPVGVGIIGTTSAIGLSRLKEKECGSELDVSVYRLISIGRAD
jgi:hypothetical protein